MNANLNLSLVEEEAEVRKFPGESYKHGGIVLPVWDRDEVSSRFVDESTLDKHVRVLKIQDAAANATVDYINKMGQEGTADEYIVGTELKKVEDSSSFNPCWRIRE